LICRVSVKRIGRTFIKREQERNALLVIQ
jgi:hypothetical protein